MAIVVHQTARFALYPAIERKQQRRFISYFLDRLLVIGHNDSFKKELAWAVLRLT
jgi:hypothetical protein